jgi:hypothetical protein
MIAGTLCSHFAVAFFSSMHEIHFELVESLFSNGMAMPLAAGTIKHASALNHHQNQEHGSGIWDLMSRPCVAANACTLVMCIKIWLMPSSGFQLALSLLWLALRVSSVI